MLTFGGMRFARGPLTLGQRTVLENLSDHTHNIERVVPVQDGVDLAGVSTAVHALVCRHETLRTRFPAGDREQVVDGAGMLSIRLCGSVEEARTALVTSPFDIVAEWGIRVGVVCRDDRPATVVLCLSPLAVDAWAADLVAEDLRALLLGTSLPVPSSQPLDQAEADSLRDQEESLAHLRKVLLTAPAEPPGTAADPDAWHLGELRSGAVDPAARAVAARCHTMASVVYLAAAAVGLGAGQHVLRTITRGRETPAELACVAPFALEAFVPVDASGEKFDTVVERAFDAYRAVGRYEPAAVRSLVAEVASERGSRPDLSVLVNDMRAGTRPTPASAETTFSWGEPFRLPGLLRYLAIADDGDAVTLSLLANGARDDVPAFLHGMADLIVAAADGDVDTGTWS